jgi:YgiT-type zinc finger domain-containing protein
MTDHNTREILCDECQAGVLRLRFVTYFTWLGDELVTVPNFPAWVCDVCGRREFDRRAITWLTTMLDPETGKRRSTRQPMRRHSDKGGRARPSTD